ncbi:MAG: hypothetical protein WBQ60_10505 [Asticcacaulis sp.]
MKKLWLVVVGVMLFIALPALAADPKVAHDKTMKVEVIGEIKVADRTDPTQSPCAPKSEIRTSDLCAQWKAADAARDATKWALGSLIVSIITLLAVGYGFYQADQTQKKEFRAYVRLDEPVIQFTDSGNLRVKLRFTNYGRTPASNMHGLCRFDLCYRKGGYVTTKHAEFFVMEVHQGPELRREIISEGGFATDAQHKVDDGSAYIKLTAIFEYEDVYKMRQKEVFIFQYSGLDFDAHTLISDYLIT